MNSFSVCAGVVAHNPDVDQIYSLVENLLCCSKWLVIVDNASSDTGYLERIQGNSKVTVIHNSENRGVSGGINQIIGHAREVNAKYVTALDQDTQISPGLVDVLASNLEKLLESGEPVAAIGPLVVDDYTNYSLPFVNFRLPLNTKYRQPKSKEDKQLVECDFLISSGCLMSIEAIDVIGSMNEALFIDNVDLDWCFRAVHKKYKVYGDFGTAIRQQIGDNYTQIPFTKSVIRYHDYERIYYMTRNRIWLYRQNYTNMSWVVHDVFRFASKFVFLLLFKVKRTVLLKSTVRAIIDSIGMKPYKSSGL
jgi:rhamnosyltransferase